MATLVGVDQIARLPLLPLLAAQALLVRRRALRLPEPLGPREGRHGKGPRLRLLIAGDSSAAGVGAGTQDQALSGQLIRQLAPHFNVEWRLIATTGHTTRDTIEALRDVTDAFEVAVTALGVNDVTRGMTARQFQQHQSDLFDCLTRNLSVRRIIATGVPQMERFPVLPQPLAWVLGRQAARLDTALQQVVSRYPQALHLTLALPDDPALAAPDGYHPSPKAYALWARQVARLILDQA